MRERLSDSDHMKVCRRKLKLMEKEKKAEVKCLRFFGQWLE